MSSELTFCRVDGEVIAEAELSRRLAEGLGVPHSEVLHQRAERLVLGETGITLSLVLDDNGHPMDAMATIPFDARIVHVTRLCKIFRAMGWVL